MITALPRLRRAIRTGDEFLKAESFQHGGSEPAGASGLIASRAASAWLVGRPENTEKRGARAGHQSNDNRAQAESNNDGNWKTADS
jgi:hypothetical protein